MLSRRHFLKTTKSLLSGTISAGLSKNVVSWSAVFPIVGIANDATLDTDIENRGKHTLYASAFTHVNGTHSFAIFNEHNDQHWTLSLEDRAHAPIFHPNRAIVGIVARRAGFYLDLYNVQSSAKIGRIIPAKEHHFYGHGVFSTEGDRLLTTENHYPSGQGKIFIRDWKSHQILKQFSSYGIGPHELHLLNDSTIVVANGGLHTHPDNNREVLNLGSMSPNLAFIDITSGKLLKRLTLPKKWHQLSIRHIDVNSKGDVAVGFQYQGAPFDNVPLVAKASLNDDIMSIMPMPVSIRQRFKQYCGSVTFDKSGEILAVSSPRGGIVAYWDMVSGGYFEHHNYRDVCGIAPTSVTGQFLLTTGQGKRVLVTPINDHKEKLTTMTQYRWDNHIHSFTV